VAAVPGKRGERQKKGGESDHEGILAHMFAKHKGWKGAQDARIRGWDGNLQGLTGAAGVLAGGSTSRGLVRG